MSSLMMLLLFQFLISTKAGLVNHIEGDVNFAATAIVPAGASIKTGAAGYAEILLNPGSFLRVDQGSEVVLDSVDLTTVAVRVVSGSAVIEASGVSKKQPITVTTQDLVTEIVSSGIYLFSDGTATVRTGKLRPVDSQKLYKKGWHIAQDNDTLQAIKLGKKSPLTAIDAWSRDRSALIATANERTYNSLLPTSRSYRSDLSNIWLFNPAVGFFTYMPRHSYRSPYGDRYYAPTETPLTHSDVPSVFQTSNPSNIGTSSSGVSSGGASSGSGDSGGSAGSGGGGAVYVPPPAPVETRSGIMAIP